MRAIPNRLNRPSQSERPPVPGNRPAAAQSTLAPSSMNQQLSPLGRAYNSFSNRSDADEPNVAQTQAISPVRPGASSTSSYRPTSTAYGAFLNLPAGSRTDRLFRDTDRDGVDDRKQTGPGQPSFGGLATSNPTTSTSTSTPSTNSRQDYGAYMNLPAGSRVDRQFLDRDGDDVDDRYQSAPGQPRGRRSLVR